MTTPSSALGDDQRHRLARAKLRALARARFGDLDWAEVDLGGLVGLHAGDVGIVQLGTAAWGLGRAIVWADRTLPRGELHVVAEDDADVGGAAGVVARRAELFSVGVHAWRVEGGALEPATPSAHLPLLPPPEDALAAAEPLRVLGADLVVEHGVVMAEVLGLEVGRVVPDESAATGWSLEVGVGKNDREASVLMGALRTPEDALRNVVAVVGAQRRPDVSPHLLNRLSRPRWLRATVLERPELVGAGRLGPLEPPVPRLNLVDPAPALALGVSPEGRAMVVACMVGVDLEAVPAAADARARHAPGADLVIAAPARDLYPALRRLVDLLVEPARLVAVEGDWPR